MKYLYITLSAAVLLTAACNSDKSTRGSTADTGRLAKATDKPTAAATLNTPDIKNTPITQEINITANDQMRYSDTLFKVKAGEKVTVKLTNIGKMPKESMGHNFTLLTQGTNLADFANKALAARDNDYIPADLASSVIAHTKLVGPGESDVITFTIKDPGFYDFLCTFPGHYGAMRGKIAVE